MARMLESLKRGYGMPQGAVPAEAPKPHAQSGECVMEWALDEAEVPFIEVGGPGKVLEGSAEVLAVAHPAQAKQPPHPSTEQALAHSSLLAQVAQPRPLAVTFEPWTGPRIDSSAIAREIVVHHQPEHAISKQYAGLWNTLAAGIAEVSHPLLVFVGLKPHVGTTTVLLNLAVTAAQRSQRRLVVVDAQLQRPGIAPRLGFTPEADLDDVLAGRAALEHCVLGTAVPALHVLPALPRQPNQGLATEGIAWLAGRLRQRFDLVLVDAPELENVRDIAAWIAAADGWFLVCPHGESRTLPRSPLDTMTRFAGKLRGVFHTAYAA
ncbi:MAG: hypothetical protein NZO58_04915 [Gemmataceae bacterium]|nr:hypothetical protein [Gemmataceae bacterium]